MQYEHEDLEEFMEYQKIEEFIDNLCGKLEEPVVRLPHLDHLESLKSKQKQYKINHLEDVQSWLILLKKQ